MGNSGGREYRLGFPTILKGLSHEINIFSINRTQYFLCVFADGFQKLFKVVYCFVMQGNNKMKLFTNSENTWVLKYYLYIL
jgi:hypothetical protein